MKTLDPYLRNPEQTVELNGTSFPLEYLYRGTLITGQPGSGKTRCVLLPLIKSILASTGTQSKSKCSMMIADPKNELAPLLEQLLAEVGRPDDLVVLKPGTAHYNPLANPILTESEIPEKIINWANNTHRSVQRQARGDSEFWANAQRSLLAALVSATRAIHGELTFTRLNELFRRIERFDGIKDASKWLQEREVPDTAIRGIADFLTLPKDTTRPCVSTSMAGVLYFWDNQPLDTLVTPGDSTVAVDPFDLVHEGKIFVVGCSSAAFGTSITPLLLALKEHFLITLLARDQIEVQEGGEWTLINQTRPVFIVADEFQAYMSTDSSVGELTALDRLRGFNAGMICATQNISSIESVLGHPAHATRLISLLSNQLYLGNICPSTGAMAEHIFGKKKIREYHTDCSHQMESPLLFRKTKSLRKPDHGRRTQTSRDVPRVDASALAALKTGQYWLRLASGEIFRPASAKRIAEQAKVNTPGWNLNF